MNKKEFAVIAVITFLVFIAWLVFDILHNTKANITLSPNLQNSLTPINATFDKEALDWVKNLQPLTSNQSQRPIQVAPPATPSATPLVNPPATQSAIQTPVASSSGNQTLILP
jgi:hypothetical protein